MFQKRLLLSLSFIPLTQHRESQKIHAVNQEEETMLRSAIGQANWLVKP